MLPVREKIPHVVVRILFAKTGDLQYISHLDLHRAFTRMLVRAGVPLWYSEGYSPHPRLAFATPLSVGAESEYELVDVYVVGDAETINPAALFALIRDTHIPGLVVKDLYLPARPFSAITHADYTIRIRTAGADAALVARCAEALAASPLVVRKRTKKGERDVDISPQIQSVRASYEDGGIVLRARLAADSANFLNPEYLVKILRGAGLVLCGDVIQEEYSILRTAVYGGDTLFR